MTELVIRAVGRPGGRMIVSGTGQRANANRSLTHYLMRPGRG